MDLDFSVFDTESVTDRYKRSLKATLDQMAAEREAAMRVPDPSDLTQRPHRATAKRFSTQCAIAWGRKRGWDLLDRERYDYRLKRHHDCLMGSDALFETATGMAGVQGAGRSERKTHRDRFENMGGAAKAMKLGIGFWYVEFDSLTHEVVREERWA